MSLESAHADLQARVRELGQAVTELVTIVHEDRPHGSEIAVIDALSETVSELQASAVHAGEVIARVRTPRELPAVLGHVDDAVARCRSTYWRDLRAHRPLSVLRRTASEHGREWRTWQRSIELSLSRCEPGLAGAEDSLRGAWAEVAELLTLYSRPDLRPDVSPDASPDPSPDPSPNLSPNLSLDSTAMTTDVSTSSRRQS
jgi:hypothetical protein